MERTKTVCAVVHPLHSFWYACMLSHFSCVSVTAFFVTLRTIVCQAPQSMGFSRQEYWGGLPFQPPGDLPNPSVSYISSTGSWVLEVLNY